MSPSNTGLPAVLNEEHLNQVASWLLEEWYATENDLVRETDTRYTVGTARFGRQKQRISNEYMSRRHAWLRVENNGLDMVFSINGIPCRFSNDNADAPKKRAVLEVHPFQMSLIEESEPGAAARFVFVIDQGFSEIDEPRVLFLGFSASGQEVCRWCSTPVLRKLVNARSELPNPIDLPKPIITPKLRDIGDDAAAIGT